VTREAVLVKEILLSDPGVRETVFAEVRVSADPRRMMRGVKILLDILFVVVGKRSW
jgi:hypothetical protein